jgi:hypothetical protein
VVARINSKKRQQWHLLVWALGQEMVLLVDVRIAAVV